ncbi:MAG: monovalent cation/H(+) antiporter subunit G [Caldilineaceae bacterium]|nr:monovalent cation/H(+) antiporter subunit G [Caldilineaceae bacterium]
MNQTVREILVLVLASGGVFFMIVSAIGIFRLPDVLTRMHAFGKAATLGIIGVLLSVGVYFSEEHGIFFRMIFLVLLFFITSPIAATAMGRAAYRKSRIEELALVHDEMAELQESPGRIQSTAKGPTL